MQKYGIRGATDITGFGLLGHAKGLAEASGVCLHIDSRSVPALPECLSLLRDGCIPGAAFRNLRFVGDMLRADCPTEHKMLLADAQTSGGLLMAVDADRAEDLVADFHRTGLHPFAAIIGYATDAEEAAKLIVT